MPHGAVKYRTTVVAPYLRDSLNPLTSTPLRNPVKPGDDDNIDNNDYEKENEEPEPQLKKKRVARQGKKLRRLVGSRNKPRAHVANEENPTRACNEFAHKPEKRTFSQ